VFPDVAEALAEYLAGMDVAGLGHDQVQPARITGDQPAVLDQCSVDQPALYDVLRRLQPGARKTMDAGRSLLQVLLQPVDGAAVFPDIDSLVAFLAKIAADHRDGVRASCIEARDEIDDLVHPVLVFGQEDGIDAEFEIGVVLAQRAQ